MKAAPVLDLYAGHWQAQLPQMMGTRTAQKAAMSR
jgi:hypothetical protein